ncbi:MAG: TolC family protein [Bacteroidales bacterium]|jgi:outer membrane protein TolC
MLKRAMSFLVSVFIIISSPAQEKKLTLQECLQKAALNHPLSDQAGYLAATGDLKSRNLNRNYLPEFTINGNIHYQSDVTEVPIRVPQFEFEALSKDWYKISLDASQVIWDGGITRRSKEVEELDNMIGLQNVGIEMYRIRERVITAYFNILALQEQKSLLELHLGTLQSQLDEVESGIRHGAVLASNADILKAEMLKMGQRLTENELNIVLAYKILSLLTGEEIAVDTDLQMPVQDIYMTAGGQDRLEYGLFSLQEQKAESMKKVVSSRLMPRFVAYGQAGYGRPGFDMLKNEFDDFYMIGARMSWNFWDWNKGRNEKTILDLNRNIIQSNRDHFSQNISIELERKQAEVLRYHKLIEKDEEIAELRAGISKTYASRLANGVITATEYITELNAETEALLNLKIHQVQLVKATYDYLATAGKL